MSLIIREESEKLRGKQVVIPDEVAKKLYQNMNTYANDKTSDGYKRLRSLTNKDYNRRSDGKDSQHNNKMTISFGDARRIAHDMKHMPQNPNNKEFNMLGGFDTYQAVKNGLKQARNAVKQNSPVPPVPKLDKSGVKAPDVKTDEIKMGDATVTVKEIMITDRQAMMLKEYHNELNIPFNKPDQAYDPKMNYQHLVDFFEQIGKYGQLPPSNNQNKNKTWIPYDEINEFLKSSYNNTYPDLSTPNATYKSIQFVKEHIESDPEFFQDAEKAEEILNEYYETESLFDFASEYLTPEGVNAFKEWIKYEMRDDLEYDIRLTSDERGLIYIERQITIPSLMSSDYGREKHIADFYGDGDFKTYYDMLINDYGGLGTAWTYKSGKGEAYCGEHFAIGTSYVTLYGLVSPDDVEWESTFNLNLLNEDEYELNIREGAPIELYQIIVNSSYEGNDKEMEGKKLPLKGPIIVPA